MLIGVTIKKKDRNEIVSVFFLLLFVQLLAWRKVTQNTRCLSVHLATSWALESDGALVTISEIIAQIETVRVLAIFQQSAHNSGHTLWKGC